MSDVYLATIPRYRGVGDKTITPSSLVVVEPHNNQIGAPASSSSAASSTTWAKAPIVISGIISCVLLTTKLWRLLRPHDDRHGRSRPISSDETLSKTEGGSSDSEQFLNGGGEYHKMKEIGRGAYGIVFVGRHERTGELVAIKEMDIAVAEDLEVEWKLLRGLSHPNIVSIRGFELGKRHARLFLEWVAGGSLSDLLHRYGPVNERLLRNYVRQILHGLSFLHRKGILHRDIKPKNILVDHKGFLKLTDFGLSRHLDSMLDKTRVAGTPVYMAPECVKGSFCVGSDIWAMGATICELATCKLPWSHLAPHILKNQCALLFHIGSLCGSSGHHPAIPTVLSDNARDFLHVCFSPNPEDRLDCEKLLLHPFLVTEDDDPTLSYESSQTSFGMEATTALASNQTGPDLLTVQTAQQPTLSINSDGTS